MSATTCGGCGALLLAPDSHICPRRAELGITGLGVTDVDTVTELWTPPGDDRTTADVLAEAAAQIDAAPPAGPRPALRFPLDTYSPDPPSTPDAAPPAPATPLEVATAQRDAIVELLEDGHELAHKLTTALEQLADEQTRQAPLAQRVVDVAATLPPGIRLAIIIDEEAHATGMAGPLLEQVGHRWQEQGTGHLSASRDAANGRTTVVLTP